MPYTHSLVGAVLWSTAAGFIYYLVRRVDGSLAALIVAAAVFSHWVLDLLVHRPDLPIYDNAAKVGLGLWNFRVLALGLEAAVLFGGMLLYFGLRPPRRTAVLVFGVIMFLVQVYLAFGPPPASDKSAAIAALAAYVVFAVVIRALEGRSALPLAPH